MATTKPRLHYKQYHAELEETLRTGGDVVEFCRSRSTIGTETEGKAVVDTTFRERLQGLLAEEDAMSNCERLLAQSFDASAAEVSTRSLPVMLLTDMFELSTLASCERLFTLVEDRVATWKEDQFFRHVKNQLLRCCNDLLRRLSRSKNTVFCGRILVFLARFFPLFERSGLNLISEFNAEYMTSVVGDEPVIEAPEVEGMEEGEMRDGPNEQQLYRKFWRLQDVFRAPNACYESRQWGQFQACAQDVLALFEQQRLEQAAARPSAQSVFFSQYLTSARLLDLQLSDANFRRYILIQFLIAFQTEAQTLAEDKTTWIRDAITRIYRILDDTPPDGPTFRQSVENVLGREEAWNQWKNDGCSELKPSERLPPPPQAKRLKTDSSCPELKRLWEDGPDNFEACRSPRRLFTPAVETFFGQVLHATPTERAQQFRRPEFCWRALRLLSQKSAHFFLPSNQMVKPLPDYLASALDRLSQDLPRDDQELLTDGAEDISDDELLRQAEPDEPTPATNGLTPTATTEMAVTQSLIEDVATLAAAVWRQLATHLLDFGSDELDCFESSHESPVEQAKLMLQVWSEQDNPARVTVERLTAGLEKCGIPFQP